MIATPLRSPLTCLPPLLVPCSLRPSPLYMFASSPLNTCCVSSLLTTLLRLLSPNTFGTPPLPLSSSLYLLSPGIFVYNSPCLVCFPTSFLRYAIHEMFARRSPSGVSPPFQLVLPQGVRFGILLQAVYCSFPAIPFHFLNIGSSYSSTSGLF